MSGFKDGGQVIVPVPLEFTGTERVSPHLAKFSRQMTSCVRTRAYERTRTYGGSIKEFLCL